ncbi:hypothetical protein OHU34_38290 [Streptomyces sp. NBC_00080]|uniref:hypothetical protein n=1 Tax=Streptomyces sp. NBC_00080 TaxID=2975645 RepID=UPI0032488FF9
MLTREASSLAVYAGYLEQLDLMQVATGDRPAVPWLIDPMDYLVPMSFDIDDNTWRGQTKLTVMRALDRLTPASPHTVRATRTAGSSEPCDC